MGIHSEFIQGVPWFIPVFHDPCAFNMSLQGQVSAGQPHQPLGRRPGAVSRMGPESFGFPLLIRHFEQSPWRTWLRGMSPCRLGARMPERGAKAQGSAVEGYL